MDSNRSLIIGIIVIIIVLIFISYNSKRQTDSDSLELKLRTDVSKLMTEHAVYTRLFIVAATDKQDAQMQLIVNRLMRNQEEIGNAVRPIVGNRLADKLIRLLKEHIEKAGKTVGMAIGGNKQAIDKALIDLRNNSDRTARALTAINPDILPLEMTKKQFWKHNQFVYDQTVLRIEGKYEEDIKIYDEYYSHMLMLGNAISSGLLKK